MIVLFTSIEIYRIPKFYRYSVNTDTFWHGKNKLPVTNLLYLVVKKNVPAVIKSVKAGTFFRFTGKYRYQK